MARGGNTQTANAVNSIAKDNKASTKAVPTPKATAQKPAKAAVAPKTAAAPVPKQQARPAKSVVKQTSAVKAVAKPVKKQQIQVAPKNPVAINGIMPVSQRYRPIRQLSMIIKTVIPPVVYKLKASQSKNRISHIKRMELNKIVMGRQLCSKRDPRDPPKGLSDYGFQRRENNHAKKAAKARKTARKGRAKRVARVHAGKH